MRCGSKKKKNQVPAPVDAGFSCRLNRLETQCRAKDSRQYTLVERIANPRKNAGVMDAAVASDREPIAASVPHSPAGALPRVGAVLADTPGTMGWISSKFSRE